MGLCTGRRLFHSFLRLETELLRCTNVELTFDTHLFSTALATRIEYTKMALKKTGNAFVQDHDPDDQSDYTFRFRLPIQESIASAIVQVVDPVTDEPPVVPSDLILADVSFGTMPDDLAWGVTVWVTGGTPGFSYYLRCQITTDSSPLPRLFTRTMRLHCSDQ